ncbi:MAG: iron-containing alcohol dehydrogenase, partial [Kiritimatiellae bacterium]|nr:iron-containing alcohol dehydrogenase [Kiritimatiellia bacterium]
MHKKAVFPGKYIQGAGAIGELPGLMELLGRKGLILASPTACQSILPACGVDWVSREVRMETFRGECCEAELARVAGLVRECGAEVLVGMGGGKAIDTAKIVADREGVPVIVVPTIASTDAPCSGCAVIYSQ